MNRTFFIKAGMSACAVLAMLAAAQTGRTRSGDEWRIKRSGDSGKVHFTIERSRPGSRWVSSSDVPLDHFRGLSLAALDGTGAAKFELVRDAARLLCTGQFTNGRGIGTFQLAPNPQFASDLQRLGYEAPSDQEIFSMLMSDVSIEFARGVKDAGVASTTKQLVDMRIHGVDLDYVRQMRASGYSTLTAPDYVEMRVHGVTPELVTELKRAGYDMPAKKIVEMRIHGVTPAYISELTAYGMKPTASEVVQMRIHGVTGDYLRKLRDSGFQNLTPEKIVKLRIHGID